MESGKRRSDMAGAEIIAVEVHPKRPGMYRVAVRVLGAETADPDKTDVPPADWHEEVDALIAGASIAQAPAVPGSDTVVTVHEDTLVSLRLLKGRWLAPEEWERLQREEALEDAYRAALSMLERKARTSRELSDALKRKGYDADIIRSCVDRLFARRVLDDSAYARRFAEQRVTSQRKGRRLIRQELLQRGITKEDVDQALEQLDENAERDSAFALARKKWPQTKGDRRERKMKLAAFLLRRGYPNRIVRSAVDRVMAELEEREIPDGADWAD